MSQENVELVRRCLEPYDGKDVVPIFRDAVDRLSGSFEPDAVLALWADDPSWRYLHPEAVFEVSWGGLIDAKATGPIEIARWWATDWADAWESYAYSIVEYRDLGEWVLTPVEVRATGRGGIPVEMRTFQIWSVRDGKVAVSRSFGNEAEALEAAGLSE
jgi:ketosteroid isomerase-like protein